LGTGLEDIEMETDEATAEKARIVKAAPKRKFMVEREGEEIMDQRVSFWLRDILGVTKLCSKDCQRKKRSLSRSEVL
jgi:hypothetical protein